MSGQFRPELAQLISYHTPQQPEGDKLDANELPYDLPEWFKSKLVFVSEQVVRANRYPDSDPVLLRQQIAQYCHVKAQQVCVGNGSDELIRSVIIAACLGGRGAVLSAEPTFGMYRILAETLGVPYITLARDEAFGINPDAMHAAVLQHGVRVVFLANPNSPTATLLAGSVLRSLRTLPEDVLVVLDEAYYEFSGFTCASWIADWPNLIILRTFSKAFRLASYRVGYALGRPELIRVLDKTRLPYNLPAVSQLAATLAMEHRSELLAVIPELLAERDRVAASLQELPNLQLWPSSANFLYMRSTQHEPESMRKMLAERGTLIRASGGGLRVTIGTPAENDKLLVNFASLD